MMEETPPTNELIDRLMARLSPEAWTVQEKLDALTDTLDAGAPEVEVEARMDEAIDLMAALPEDDQMLLQQIAQLKAREHERRSEEYMDEARFFENAARQLRCAGPGACRRPRARRGQHDARRGPRDPKAPRRGRTED
jgi:hypothetical protein